MIVWLKNIFSGERQKTVSDVISAYGELLEKYPGSVLDVSMLPMPKVKMKILLKALYAKAKNAEQENIFETGFMFLSKFQDGVGATPIDGKLSDGSVMENLKTDVAIMDKWMPWQKLSMAETGILLAEWQCFKEGEPI